VASPLAVDTERARREIDDRVRGLQTGGDDYLT
jgi:DNA-binding response OmpR family regulator